ncbi:MAG: hypothetical protein C1943_08225 [Halochromatium sp.]|nr:hypothetical protein [Halochromatium sp.]
MSERDDRLSLRDMLAHAREAVELLGDGDRAFLARQRVLQLALTRLVEIIGEAANRVSHETRQNTSEIPWRAIIGMRNRLVHGYDVIDYERLWDTITQDLPPLISALEGAIKDDSYSL